MQLLGWAAATAQALSRNLTASGQTAVYVRQLFRGNGEADAGVGVPAARGSDGELADRAPWLAPPGFRPVLLLQGYLSTTGSLHLLRRRLAEQRHRVHACRLGWLNTRDVRATAAHVARRVESLCGQDTSATVDVVAHSMGGLAALYYARRLGGWRRLRRLVLLGTPVGGTPWAALGALAAPLGAGGVQMLPGSDLLDELRSRPDPPGARLVTIAGARDWVAPPARAEISGAVNLVMPCNHSGLVVDADVARRVDAILRT